MATTTQEVTHQEIRDTIVGLLVEEFDIDPEMITDTVTMEELDLDSLDMVEIGQVAEQKFGVRVKPTDAEGVTDFSGVIDMIHRLANRPPEEASKEDAKDDAGSAATGQEGAADGPEGAASAQ